MSFDLASLHAAVEAHGAVARIVVARAEGSAPREAGAAMLVWATGQSGTIGGGALEFEAALQAKSALVEGRDLINRTPLGPALGQCCGGAVTLLTEVWTAERLHGLAGGDIVARPLPGGPHAMPLSVRRALAAERSCGVLPEPAIRDGWIVEPVLSAKRALWIWGAGHVGRAIVGTLAPLPAFQITWIDTGSDRFPDEIPDRVVQLVAANPADAVAHAARDADHLILTYSHALDLELCHRLLRHAFASCGLIGSRTKWARFRSRLSGLGHTEASIGRIRCPIGEPELGKHPQAIAVSVAHELLRPMRDKTAWKDGTG